jgi:hypothetical protein
MLGCMNSFLRLAFSLLLVTQLTGCQTATGLLDGVFGTAGRMLSSMGRTVGVGESTPIKQPLKMAPRDLDKAKEELQNSTLPAPERKVNNLAQAR